MKGKPFNFRRGDVTITGLTDHEYGPYSHLL
jgi:hypothetical protein